MSAITASYVIGDAVRLPDWLMRMNLSCGAKLTYNVLAACSGGRDRAWPGQTYLARQISASVRSVQRYLSELSRQGLIAVTRETIKGKLRCLYIFLPPEAKTAARGDNSSLLAGRPGVSGTERTKSCQVEPDDLSPLYKEESIKGKENIPPTPQPSDPEPNLPAIEAGPGGAGANFEKAEEAGKDSPAEAPLWSRIKARLQAEWGESAVKTWLEPLEFAEQGRTAVLKTPNAFFLRWLEGNYFAGLKRAFHEAGYEARLELGAVKRMTPKEENHRLPAAVAPPREPDWEALTLEERFSRLYEAYPRKENFWRGLRAFKALSKRGECPMPGQLLQAIDRQERGEAWRREDGRFVPQITKWLMERRWLDLKPAGLGAAKAVLNA